MKEISKAILAYVAGFIDGEGYIGYVKKSDRKNNYTLQVRVSNTDYGILSWIQHTLNSGRIIELKGITNLHRRKPCYQWYCYGDEARYIVNLLAPYLRIKAGQGRLI